MKVMFVNTREPACGVHQYGLNLFAVLSRYLGDDVTYCHFDCEEAFRRNYTLLAPDVVIYNWQQGVGGWMAGAPFLGCGKQVLAYHDLEARFSDFDAILFSDPTMAQHDNWYPIGRPIPNQYYFPRTDSEIPRIGINGFVGAWAHHVISQLALEFETCHVRFHLPYATFGDANGDIARASARQCLELMPKNFTHEISYDFMGIAQFMSWLSSNDINCYFRDLIPWRGVSSSIDAALAVRRPVAINRCSAFRHMHDCQPSICVEDRKITDIIQTGLSPLVAKYKEYDPDVVASQVRKVLELVVGRA